MTSPTTAAATTATRPTSGGHRETVAWFLLHPVRVAHLLGSGRTGIDERRDRAGPRSTAGDGRGGDPGGRAGGRRRPGSRRTRVTVGLGAGRGRGGGRGRRGRGGRGGGGGGLGEPTVRLEPGRVVAARVAPVPRGADGGLAVRTRGLSSHGCASSNASNFRNDPSTADRAHKGIGAEFGPGQVSRSWPATLAPCSSTTSVTWSPPWPTTATWPTRGWPRPSSWPSGCGRPLLLEGEAGVGKTEVAKVVARWTGGRADPPPVLRGHRRRARRSTSGTTPASSSTCGRPRPPGRPARAADRPS